MKMQNPKKTKSAEKPASGKLMFGLFGRWSVAGFFVGAVLGYVFYATIGCKFEACIFISNPYITSGWGALLMFVVFEVFRIITLEAKK
jgi:hypothetical protein